MLKEIQIFKMGLTDSVADFEQIIELNQLNIANMISRDLWATEGFLTLEFDALQLDQMRGPYKHVVAKNKDEVIGYALVLLKEQRHLFPFFDPMFETIDSTIMGGAYLKDSQYFVMAQICVAKKFRGKGVFKALYQKLALQMDTDFNKVVIEVSPKNERSISAHHRIGFGAIIPKDINGAPVEWEVLVWNFK